MDECLKDENGSRERNAYVKGHLLKQCSATTTTKPPLNTEKYWLGKDTCKVAKQALALLAVLLGDGVKNAGFLPAVEYVNIDAAGVTCVCNISTSYCHLVSEINMEYCSCAV